MVVVSQRFRSELRSALANGTRQYQIARQAQVHPSTVSQIIHDALPIKRGDPRVVRLAAQLGLSERDAFGGDDAA